MGLLAWLFKSDFVWAGWLYGDPDDIDQLKALGVHGPMVWKANEYRRENKSGRFEFCLCDDSTLKELVKLYNPGFDPSVEKALTPYPKSVFSPYSYKRAAEEWGWTKE